MEPLLNMDSNSTYTISKSELWELATGVTFLATGGGGSIEFLSPLIDKIIANNNTLIITHQANLSEHDIVVVPAVAFAPSHANKENISGLIEDLKNSLNALINKDEKPYLATVETGVANTFFTILLALELNLPLVDSSGADRSVPAFSDTVFSSIKFSDLLDSRFILSSRTSMVTVQANEIDNVNISIMEILSGHSFEHGSGMAMWKMAGSLIKEKGISGTLLKSLKIGRSLRAASTGEELVNTATEMINGKQIITGIIFDVSHETHNSHDFMIVSIKSISQLPNTEIVSIYISNENIIAWTNMDSTPIAMAPDLLCYICLEGTNSENESLKKVAGCFTNADLSLVKGKKISLIAAPGNREIWSDPIAVESFGTAIKALGYGGKIKRLESDIEVHATNISKEFNREALQKNIKAWGSKSKAMKTYDYRSMKNQFNTSKNK